MDVVLRVSVSAANPFSLASPALPGHVTDRIGNFVSSFYRTISQQGATGGRLLS